MMKKKITYGIVVLSLIGLVSIPIGCKKLNPDNYSINIDTDVFTSPMLITFQNANDKAVNQPLNFKLTISGDDKDKVITSLGTTNFEVHDGWIALNLAKGVVATVDNPIKFIISASVPGFENIRSEVSVKKNDEIRFEIKVIETNNLPKGIAEEKTNFSLNAGQLIASQTFSTLEENETTESVSLTFPAGVKMLDESGNLVSGSSVEAKVRYYDITDESIKTFPGSLSPQNVYNKAGKKIDEGVNFFTAGLMDIDLKVGSTQIKKFDKVVSAVMQINSSQDNFITGDKVKVGDKIPVWSLDETTGQWKEESEATVESSADGLIAKFDIQHLSCWNLSWGWNYKSNNSKLDVKFLTPWENSIGDYEITLRSPNGGYLGALHGASIFNGYVATFVETPNIPSAYIEVYDNQLGKIIAKTDLFNPGTKGSVSIQITPPTSDYVDISLAYSIVCTNNLKLKPDASAWITITDLETNKSQHYYTGITANKLTKGQLDIRLINKRKYKVSTLGLDGKIVSCEVLLDVNNLTYQLINGLSVKKLEYNSTTKKITVVCEYTTNKC